MKAILTGTAAYGPFTDESDIDIVVLYWEVEGITKALKTLGIKVHNFEHINKNYEGIYFEFVGRKIQIITACTELEMEAWSYATDEMKKLNVYKDRERRVKIFQRFYSIFCKGAGIRDVHDPVDNEKEHRTFEPAPEEDDIPF